MGVTDFGWSAVNRHLCSGLRSPINGKVLSLLPSIWKADDLCGFGVRWSPRQQRSAGWWVKIIALGQKFASRCRQRGDFMRGQCKIYIERAGWYCSNLRPRSGCYCPRCMAALWLRRMLPVLKVLLNGLSGRRCTNPSSEGATRSSGRSYPAVDVANAAVSGAVALRVSVHSAICGQRVLQGSQAAPRRPFLRHAVAAAVFLAVKVSSSSQPGPSAGLSHAFWDSSCSS